MQPFELDSPLMVDKSGGVTLEDGRVITKDGISAYKIPTDCAFLNENAQHIIVVCEDSLRILDREAQQVQQIHYSQKPLAASLDNDILAIVLADNTIMLQDVLSQQILFSQKQPNISAITNKNANPYFLRDLVIFPTLDGAVVIVDKTKLEVLRKVVVSNATQFNNVIFLDIFNNRLIAATKFRVIAVSPEYISTQNANVREILVLRDRIYVFTTDGEVLLCDINLNVQKRIKFSFAHFLSVGIGEDIALLEKRGYVIALDVDFESFRVYKITETMQLPSFGDTQALYFGKYYIKFP